METKGKLTPLAQPHVTQATFREALDPRGVGIGSDPAGSRLSQGTEVGGLGTQTQRLFGMCFNGARCRMMSQEHVTITTRITLRCRSLGFRVKAEGVGLALQQCSHEGFGEFVCVYTYIYMYICIYVYTNIVTYIYIYMHICTHCVYLNVYVHIKLHTHNEMNMHSYAQTNGQPDNIRSTTKYMPFFTLHYIAPHCSSLTFACTCNLHLHSCTHTHTHTLTHTYIHTNMHACVHT